MEQVDEDGRKKTVNKDCQKTDQILTDRKMTVKQ